MEAFGNDVITAAGVAASGHDAGITGTAAEVSAAASTCTVGVVAGVLASVVAAGLH